MPTPCWWLDTLVLVAVLSPGAGAQATDHAFLLQPADQRVSSGERVVLPCRLNFESRVQWTKNGFGLGMERELPGFETMSMIGDDLNRDWDLQIYPVRAQDEATYQCQVLGSLSVMRSRVSRLSVVSLPLEPSLSSGPRLTLREGRVATLSCTVKGARPPVKVKWTTERTKLKEATNEDKLEADMTYTTVSEVKLVPVREWDGTVITCTAGAKSVSTQLRVNFKPKIKIKILNESPLKEGDKLEALCETSASPPATNITWFLDDEEIGNEEESITIDPVRREQNGKQLKCRAGNSVGVSEETKAISMQYGPRFTVEPKPKLALQGSKVTFFCSAESSPRPRYTWYRNNNSLKDHLRLIQIVNLSQNLTITAEPSTEGLYTCQASTRKFPSIISQAVSLELRRKPQCVSSELQYGFLHKETEVLCQGFTSPDTQVEVEWSVGGSRINTDSSYRVDVSQLGSNFLSSLTIMNTTAEDFTTYTCRASNEVGTSEAEILLVQRGSLQTLRLVLSILGVLSSLTVLAVGVWFCRNMRLSCLVKSQRELDLSSSPNDATRSPFLPMRSLFPTDTGSSNGDEDDALEAANHNLNSPIPEYSAFYGNPHLSPIGSVTEDLHLYEEAGGEYAAYYGNPLLSSRRREAGEEAEQEPRATRQRVVNFKPQAEIIHPDKSHSMEDVTNGYTDSSLFSEANTDVYTYTENAFFGGGGLTSEDDASTVLSHSI